MTFSRKNVARGAISLGLGTIAALAPIASLPSASAETVTDAPIPASPGVTGNPDTLKAKMNQSITFNPLDNDVLEDSTDAWGKLEFQQADGSYGDTLTIPEGTFKVNPDLSVTFTPAKDIAKPLPSVTYRATTRSGFSTTSTIDGYVAPVELPAFDAQPDTFTTKQNTPVDLDLAANDRLVGFEGTTWTYTLDGADSTGKLVTDQGTFQIDPATGKGTFTPAKDFHGDVPQVKYTVGNSTITRSSTVSGTVTPVETTTPSDPTPADPAPTDTTGTEPADTTTGNTPAPSDNPTTGTTEPSGNAEPSDDPTGATGTTGTTTGNSGGNVTTDSSSTAGVGTTGTSAQGNGSSSGDSAIPTGNGDGDQASTSDAPASATPVLGPKVVTDRVPSKGGANPADIAGALGVIGLMGLGTVGARRHSRG